MRKRHRLENSIQEDAHMRATRRLFRGLPLLIAGFVGLLWDGIYLLLARLHGMGSMFEGSIPVFTMRFFGFHPLETPLLLGMGFVFLDGLLAGLLIGIAVRILLPGPPPSSDSARRRGASEARRNRRRSDVPGATAQ